MTDYNMVLDDSTGVNRSYYNSTARTARNNPTIRPNTNDSSDQLRAMMRYVSWLHQESQDQEIASLITHREPKHDQQAWLYKSYSREAEQETRSIQEH